MIIHDKVSLKKQDKIHEHRKLLLELEVALRKSKLNNIEIENNDINSYRIDPIKDSIDKIDVISKSMEIKLKEIKEKIKKV